MAEKLRSELPGQKEWQLDHTEPVNDADVLNCKVRLVTTLLEVRSDGALVRKVKDVGVEPLFSVGQAEVSDLEDVGVDEEGVGGQLEVLEKR